MSRTFAKIYLFILLAVLPGSANAQVLSGMLSGFAGFIQSLIPVAFGLAVIAFFYGVARYIYNSGSDKAAEEGRRIMVGGIIGLFVITSIWGIVAFLQSQLAFSTPQNLTLPGACTSGPTGLAETWDFRGLLCLFQSYILKLLPILASFTLVVFFWGVAKYIFSAGSPKSIETGRNIMLWGIIGLFVIISIWSIVYFIRGEFGFGGTMILLPT